ncbi:hypothetical protein BH23ACT2_BH23ACT2_29970 [soil metagenome]
MEDASHQPADLSDWNTPDRASEYLGGIPTSTLAQWRHRGIGPDYAKFGKHVRYSRTALQAFGLEKTVAGKVA